MKPLVYIDARGRFIHLCAVCGKDAAFGHDIRLSKGELGTWYCAEHRPDKNEATPATAALSAPWPGPTSSSRCAHCGEPETRGNVLLPIGVRNHVWIHDLCIEAWRASRRVLKRDADSGDRVVATILESKEEEVK
jgi:hypothetical protein